MRGWWHAIHSLREYQLRRRQANRRKPHELSLAAPRVQEAYNAQIVGMSLREIPSFLKCSR